MITFQIKSYSEKTPFTITRDFLMTCKVIPGNFTSIGLVANTFKCLKALIDKTRRIKDTNQEMASFHRG